MNLKKEFERITARYKRKRNGENLRLVSNRQYRRLRAWCIRYRTEIILALVLVLYQLLDAVSWAFWATALVFAAIALRRWWRRMGAEKNGEETTKWAKK